MCDRDIRALKEQYFGRQIVDSGALGFYLRTGSVFGDAIYFPSNPLSFNAELGFMGARYLTDFAPVAPLYQTPGYGGILPVKEQPKVDMPFPYREPVLF